MARNGSVVAGKDREGEGVDPKTFYSKDYGKLWEGDEETTNLMGKVKPRTLATPKLAFQNEDVNEARDVRTLERGDNELILSAVADWLPGVKVSILGNEAFNRKLAEVREEQDALKAALREQVSGGDIWIDDLDTYSLLQRMVIDRWDKSKPIDEYCVGDYIFICQKDDEKKGGIFSGFKVLKLVKYEEGKAEYDKKQRKRAGLGNSGKGRYNGAVQLLETDQEGEGGNSVRSRNERGAERVSELDDKRTPGNSSNARRSTSKVSFYNSEGKLIAHRLTKREASRKNNQIKNKYLRRFQVLTGLYHGTSQDFDRFDNYFLGTGAGQGRGVGFYFSSIKDIAKSYAIANPRDKNAIGETYAEANKKVDENIAELKKKGKIPLKDDSVFKSIYHSVINSFVNDILHRDGTETATKTIADCINDLKEIYLNPQIESFTFGEKESEAFSLLESLCNGGELLDPSEIKKPNLSRNLYEVSINDDTLLDWDTPLTRKQWNKVKKELNKRVDFSHGGKELLERDVPPSPKELHTYYSYFEDKNGDSVGISDILHDVGFIGHKYPVSGKANDYSKGANYVIYSGDDVNITDHIRYQRAYTGSGARWAAIPGNPLGGFDANFIGTGEGAQAYGWGFYGTSEWGIAKMYAEETSREPALDEIEELVNSIVSQYEDDAYFYNDERTTYVKFSQWLSTIAKSYVADGRIGYNLNGEIGRLKRKIDDLEDTIMTEETTEEEFREYSRDELKWLRLDLEVYKCELEALEQVNKLWEDENSDFRRELHNLRMTYLDEKRRHIYTLDFDDNAELLEWNTPLTEEQWARFIAVVKKNILRFTSEKDKNEILYASKPMSPKQLHNYAKNEIAKTQKNGPRLISELLREAGFIGHTFPAASHGRGDYSRGTNYVFYGEKDARVVDAYRWLRDENGGTMGWFNPATGEIVVRENSRIDTVLHELGWHATYAWARDNAPELFAKMREYAAKAPQEVRDAVAKLVGKVVPWRLSQQRPKIPPPTHFYHQPATTKRVCGRAWVGGGSRVCCGSG